MNTEPTITTILCFPGSSWKLEQLMPLHDYRLRTIRLAEAPAERREL
jgi:hypothetical protein